MLSESNKNHILGEINNVLTQEASKRTDCISLYQISNFIKSNIDNYELTKQKYEKVFTESFQKKYSNPNFHIKVDNINYKKKEIMFSYRLSKNPFDDHQIVFRQKGNDIYIGGKFELHEYEFLALFSKEMLEFFNITFCQLRTLNLSRFIKSVNNSNFRIGAWDDGTLFTYLLSSKTKNTKDFVLVHFCRENEYNIICNSVSILNEIHSNEDKSFEEKLFKKIFVKIDDCPEWCREALYKIRQNELDEQIGLKKAKPDESNMEEVRLSEKQQKFDDEKSAKSKKKSLFKKLF